MYGPHVDHSFFNLIKYILASIDIPEIIRNVNKFNDFSFNLEGSEAETDSEIECTIECTIEGSEAEAEYRTEPFLILRTELSVNSVCKILLYIEENGAEFSKEQYIHYFGKWINDFPKLKNMYSSILKKANFNNKTNKEKLKLLGMIKKKIDKDERIFYNKLEKKINSIYK